jgi:hypothetical protein
MTDTQLQRALLRLAHRHPKTRKHLVPMLRQAANVDRALDILERIFKKKIEDSSSEFTGDGYYLYYEKEGGRLEKETDVRAFKKAPEGSYEIDLDRATHYFKEGVKRSRRGRHDILRAIRSGLVTGPGVLKAVQHLADVAEESPPTLQRGRVKSIGKGRNRVKIRGPSEWVETPSLDEANKAFWQAYFDDARSGKLLNPRLDYVFDAKEEWISD